MSLGYLSEVERGQKEASSELLASICEALEVQIGDVLFHVAGVMSPAPAAVMASDSLAEVDSLVEVIAPQQDSVDGAGAPAALAAA